MAKYILKVSGEGGSLAEDILKEIAEWKDVSESEFIHAALATYVFLFGEVSNGKKVFILDDKEKTNKEFILP